MANIWKVSDCIMFFFHFRLYFYFFPFSHINIKICFTVFSRIVQARHFIYGILAKMHCCFFGLIDRIIYQDPFF